MKIKICPLNNGDDNNVYFPFAKGASELESQILARNVHQASPEVVDLIRTLKPYTGGNVALRGVHDLDVLDKHRALVPVIGNLRIPWCSVSFGSLNSPRERYRSSTAIRMPQWAKDLPAEERLKTTFDIIFPVQPFAGQPVVPMLKSLAEDFSRIIDAFETLCFGTVSK